MGAVASQAYRLVRGTSESDAQAEELWLDKIPRLNPGFRIRSNREQEIELFTHLGDGRELTHAFRGLEADLLRHVATARPLREIVPILTAERGLAPEQCGSLVATALVKLEDAQLVYYGDRMLVKKVEFVP